MAVFFITGRPEALRAITEAQLLTAGYDTSARRHLRPSSYAEASVIPDKTGARADIEAQSHTIVANVGDQDSDLLGGHGACPTKLVNPHDFIP